MIDLSEAFEKKPQQWGLRGDPHLWADMSRLCALPAEASLRQIHSHLLGLFVGLTGGSMDAEGSIRVDRYDSGGMSGGHVSPRFWRERGIPMLLRRCVKGKALTVTCWNVNHRTGRTPYHAEAAAAAMATGADVLVFTEFYPQAGLERFTSELREGGWTHQALSVEGEGRANRILAASRRPLVARTLPPTAVDEHLITNTLWLEVDSELQLLCSRMPTYEGQPRQEAWNWLVRLAEEVRGYGPSLLIGDLNTSLRTKAQVPQFMSLCVSWDRLQPLGRGSFFKGDLRSEIDHAFIAGPVDATAWYTLSADDYVLAEQPGALSDHAAVSVCLDINPVNRKRSQK